MSVAARRANGRGVRRTTFRGVSRRNPMEKLPVELTFRGGSEAWVLVEARGRVQAFPGHLSIYDVVQRINGRQ